MGKSIYDGGLVRASLSNGIDVVLSQGQLLKLPGSVTVTVRTGEVWITDRGRDVVLASERQYCSNDPDRSVIVVNPSSRPATVRIEQGDARGCGD